VQELKILWEERKGLSDQIPGVYKLRWERPDPEWTSWSSIPECLEEYYAVLVEKDERDGPGMTAIRMQGT
jgi:hypothetical protein